MAEPSSRPGPAVDRRPAGARAARPRPSLVVVHDTEGPRVRLGILWAATVVLAAAAGRPALAVVLAVSAALAADQVLRLRLGDLGVDAGSGRPLDGLQQLVTDPRRLPTALGAGALPLAAAAGSDTLAAAVTAVAVVVLVQRLLTPLGTRSLPDAALAMTAATAFGLAAAAPVLAGGIGTSVAVLLLVLVSAYDAGDFIVGTGASTAWEGPAAGVAAVLVVAFAAAVVPIAPLDQAAALGLGVLVAVLAPIGPPAASVLIGDGRRPARFVRRLDSMLVLGPVYAYAAAAGVG